MVCAINDDECLGHVSPLEIGEPLALCQFHIRMRGKLGQEAFEEWYSIELEDAKRKGDEA